MGKVEGLFVASRHGETPMRVDEIEIQLGVGVVSDRHGAATGSPSNTVTLIEAEALDAVARDYELAVSPEAARRNVLTRDAALNHLVDRVFRLGETILRGVELCEPCGHLEKVTGIAGVRKALVHRGGLRAEVVSGGVVRPGDRIEAVDAMG